MHKTTDRPVLTLLDEKSVGFPHPSRALKEPDGLLAVGGDLSVPRLVEAYRQGVFPWFSEGDPLLWWSPDPRAVFFPDAIHISRSLHKFLKRCTYEVTINKAFRTVVEACAEAPRDHEGTWITASMIDAYTNLHYAGHAHSVEVWQQGELAGGLYGVLSGQVFSGESMFHQADNASKAALIALAGHLGPAGLKLIDCQMPNDHLMSLGAEELPRHEYLELLHCFCNQEIPGFLLREQEISY